MEQGCCVGCGEELPARVGPGRPRKWCGSNGTCANRLRREFGIPAGERFVRLVVVRYVDSGHVHVRCDCGVEKYATAWDLRNGAVKSCGCLRRENMARLGSKAKHGLSGTPEYSCWNSIRGRILDPKHPAYPNYGGRGLTMEPEWVDDFEAFLAHVGKRPSPDLSIDRVDNDLGYLKGNLRWATAAQQTRNRRVMRDAA